LLWWLLIRPQTKLLFYLSSQGAALFLLKPFNFPPKKPVEKVFFFKISAIWDLAEPRISPPGSLQYNKPQTRPIGNRLCRLPACSTLSCVCALYSATPHTNNKALCYIYMLLGWAYLAKTVRKPQYRGAGFDPPTLWFFVPVLCKILPLLPECSRTAFAQNKSFTPETCFGGPGRLW
jgi:hypothetical protein